MRTDELDYELPPELIAREPLAERDASRLLVLDRAAGTTAHATVKALPSLLAARFPRGATLVVNDTRVIPARLRGVRPTGGRCEVFLVRALDESALRWTALARASKPLRPGAEVTVSEGLRVVIEGRTDDGLYLVALRCEDPWRAIETWGEVPLPPYLHRAPNEADRARYQTVFASRPGAVAAPTAGLHLTRPLLDSLDSIGITMVSITLHVGLGTFAPVTADDLDAHPMHEEHYEIPEATARAVLASRASGRPVLAVGTTAVRALESWGGDGPTRGATRLLIQPGYGFSLVDGLLTNFHLPRSTLLALVMAFAGVEPVRRAYREAIESRYRFYSYGDAMLIV